MLILKSLWSGKVSRQSDSKDFEMSNLTKMAVLGFFQLFVWNFYKLNFGHCVLLLRLRDTHELF